jgi:hypothetical protein
MVSLSFDIIEPRSVAMRRGKTSHHNRAASWVSFAVAPERGGHPEQIIWLVSAEADSVGATCHRGYVRDGKRTRALTDATEGILRLRCFHKPPEPGKHGIM